MAQIIHVFDAYGTLFDVHSAVSALKDEVGPEAARLSDIWRAKTLEYTWIHALTGKPSSFRKLLRASLTYAMAATGVPAGDLAGKLMAAYDTLAPFPEVKDALVALRKTRSRIAILSNGDGDMLDMAARSAGIDAQIDMILSVADVGIFKPSSRVYRLAMTKFGAAKEEITFVSSNRWDIAGATAFGFATVWVNRAGLPDEYLEMPAGRIVPDLKGLPLLSA